MTPSSSRTLFVCASLCLVTFGIVLTTLGAVLPSVRERFASAKTSAGAVLLVLTWSVLAGAMVFGPVVDRYGYQAILVAATGLVIAGLEGVAFAPSMGWLRLAVFLTGFGGGIINGGANTLVSDISGDARGPRLNLLGVFFGVGAMGVPFGLALLTDRLSHAVLIASVGALVLVPLAVIATTRFPPPKQAQGFPLADAGRLLRDPLMLLMGVMLFLESGMEITVGGWTSTFVTEELVASERTALILLSLYWAGMMLARLAIGTVLGGASAFRILSFSLLIALAGAAMLLGTDTIGIAVVGVFLLGVGFAAMFPTVLGFIGTRYVALAGTAFSAAFVMALSGGMLLPYSAGVLGDRFGMRGALLIVPAALAILAVLLGILSRRLRRA
jgi:FHS family glucose/mannose:H+ symporter-like MFS transporter